jgi:hypothetical protein
VKIGLLNFEPEIVNTAMMMVSSYHKDKGDEVDIYSPLFEYDKIYGFSIFSFTDHNMSKYCQIKGGTGFDLTTKLPKEIENCLYDWSLYPKCDYSIIWFSRGCIRSCPFCVVREKEGYIHTVEPKNLNPKGTYIKVMDNNFFANPNWRTSIELLQVNKQPVDFQGVDVRLLDKEMCDALNSLKHKKQIHIAWDNPKEQIDKDIERVIQWIKPYRLMCYVLVGFNSTKEEDMYRLERLRELNIDPYVMPFNLKDQYQKDLRRWCNRHALFKACSFQDYKPRKEVIKYG